MKDNISDFPGYYVTVDGKVSIRAHRRVIRLKSLGGSSSRIGKRFKVNRTCINRILNKYEALLK